jgi:hypothetical protein
MLPVLDAPHAAFTRQEVAQLLRSLSWASERAKRGLPSGEGAVSGMEDAAGTHMMSTPAVSHIRLALARAQARALVAQRC